MNTKEQLKADICAACKSYKYLCRNVNCNMTNVIADYLLKKGWKKGEDYEKRNTVYKKA